MRFMAMASVSWASLLMEPKDMAPVAKRLTISDGGLDVFDLESAGPAGFRSSMPRSISRSRFCWFTSVREFREGLGLALAHGVLELADGIGIQQVALAAHAILIFAADAQLGVRFADGLRERIDAS